MLIYVHISLYSYHFSCTGKVKDLPQTITVELKVMFATVCSVLNIMDLPSMIFRYEYGRWALGSACAS